MYTTPTFVTKVLHLVTYIKLFLMTVKVKVTANTTLAYLYKFGFYNTLQLQLQLPYKSCRSCLTNHIMAFTYITPHHATSY